MQQPDPQSVLRALFALALAVWGSLAVWTWVGSRVHLGKKVVPYERRRPVPWGGFEVVLLMALFLISPVFFAYGGIYALGLEMPVGAHQQDKNEDKDGDKDWDKDWDKDGDEDKDSAGTAHAVEQLLRASRDLRVLLISGLMAVLVAPIVEEFMFRVLLQGWLEKLETRHRKWLPRLLRLLPGSGPVLLASLFFAAMHIRTAGPKLSVDFLLFLLTAQAVASLLTLVCAVLLLLMVCGARLSDLGVDLRRLGGDVGLGLLACLAVTAPIYLAFFAARLVLPESIAADPIPLVFLSIVLGTLYHRTHRVVPSIVLHMAFNATGLAMALLTLSG